MGTGGEAEGTTGKAHTRGLLSLAATALCLTAIAAVLLALRVPVGIPGEWWTEYRTVHPSAGQMAVLIAWMAAFLGLALAADAYARRMAAVGRGVTVGLLTAAYAMVLISAASAGPAGRVGVAAPAFKFDACGLFAREAAGVSDARTYLKGLPDRLHRMASEDYRATVRVNNNPPGTTMVFYAARRLSEGNPAIADFFEQLVFGGGFTAPTALHAAAVIGSWILLVGAALAFIPAYLVGSRMSGGQSFLAAACGMLAGSMVLFNPGNDTLQVMLYLWMAWFYLRGLGRKGWAWGALLGLTAAVGFFFSLATAVVVIVLAGWNAAHILRGAAAAAHRAAEFWTAAAVGLLLGFGGLYAGFGYNSFAVLFECYRNHSAFYYYFPRTYWAWSVYNVGEFALFMGGALSAAVIWCFAQKRRPGETAGREGVSARTLVAATLIVLALLDISGKNASEANRLWVFFMPLVALPAAGCVRLTEGGIRKLAAVAALQAANVALLVYHLDVWRIEDFLREIGKYTGQ